MKESNDIRVGTRFLLLPDSSGRHTSEYILARVELSKVCLISLTCGYWWKDHVDFPWKTSGRYIPKETFIEVCGGEEKYKQFKKVSTKQTVKGSSITVIRKDINVIDLLRITFWHLLFKLTPQKQIHIGNQIMLRTEFGFFISNKLFGKREPQNII